MNKNLTFISPEPYVAPGVRVAKCHPMRVFCLSTGNLEQDKFGGFGYAGTDAEEEDGGSLF